MKKIYKFLILILIFSGILFGSGIIVSADSTTAYVIGRNIGNDELLVKQSSASPTQTIYITDLGQDLVYIYLQTDADESFVSGFYGARIYFNTAENKWFFDRSYPFITFKEQTAYDIGYDTAIQLNYQEIYIKGFNDGKSEGFEQGKIIGYDNGYTVGKSDGYDLGMEIGYDNGYVDGTSIVTGDYGKYQLFAVGNGSMYYNWIDLENMEFHRNVLQKTYNGTENWQSYAYEPTTNYLKFYISGFSSIPIPVNTNSTDTMSSNLLPQRDILGSVQLDGITYSPSVNYLYISIHVSSIPGYTPSWTTNQRVNAFKTYLSTNNLIVNYRIYEEIETINQQILDNISVYKSGYLRGKNLGFSEGREKGYKEGEEVGYNKALDIVWLKAIFTAFSAFFAIKLFGNITIGIIVGVPLFIMMGFFVFKLIKGGN